MRIIITLILFITTVVFCLQYLHSAEPALKPFIGYEEKPEDSDTIGSIQFSTDRTFRSVGYREGDTINDFTLYTLEGNPISMKNTLKDGKPVLLVSGSYTCPVFRRKLDEINELYSRFSDSINIFIVYIVEAHPVTDICPYTEPPGMVWVTEDNEKEGILFRQPCYYKFRKIIVRELLSKLEVLPEIVIDGPENIWWDNFGPAPNNAYLINPDGVVCSKYPWFNNGGLNMEADIQKLLCNGKEDTTGVDTSSIFNFEIFNMAYQSGFIGDTIRLKNQLVNPTEKDIEMEIGIIEQNIPNGWGKNYYCKGLRLELIALNKLILKAGSSELFFIEIVTDKNETEQRKGDITLSFKNLSNKNNLFKQKYFFESKINEINSIEDYFPGNSFSFIYNQEDGILNIINNSFQQTECAIFIFDLTGNLCLNLEKCNLNPGYNSIPIDNGRLPDGIYICLIRNGENIYFNKLYNLN